MRVLVVGAGALGSWVGAQLSHSGVDTTLVARGAHGAAMAAGGLTIIGPEADRSFRISPTVVSTVGDAIDATSPPFDAILVTVKSWASATVGAEIRSAGGASGPVISLQNGVGNEAMLAAALGGRAPEPLSERAVGVCASVGSGSVTVGVSVERPGVVAASPGGGVGLARDAAGADIIADRLAAAGVPVVWSDDARTLKWSKLLLNMLGAATTAIVDRPPVDILARRDIFAIEVRAWRETLAVMHDLGIGTMDLPGYHVTRLAAAVRWAPVAVLHRLFAARLARARGERMPGVGTDLRARRSTSEIEAMHGAVAAVAAAHGMHAPTCRVLSSLVLGLADGSMDRAAFAGRPEALLAAVDAGRGSPEQAQPEQVHGDR
ncbi:MAG: 2-dehydropantoate 2-reductase N-terminal domain-containing protein [Ardenticatenales bacterium]